MHASCEAVIKQILRMYMLLNRFNHIIIVGIDIMLYMYVSNIFLYKCCRSVLESTSYQLSNAHLAQIEQVL